MNAIAIGIFGLAYAIIFVTSVDKAVRAYEARTRVIAEGQKFLERRDNDRTFAEKCAANDARFEREQAAFEEMMKDEPKPEPIEPGSVGLLTDLEGK